MSEGGSHTFVDLITQVNFIEVPILQRDYTQGSNDVADIRDAFLEDLRAALTGTSPPLDLDFIYGRIQGEKKRTLSLLDGQQRLTTLFLLHWYVALRDGRLQEFRELWRDPVEERSRFTYMTRTSSREFLDAMVREDVTIQMKGKLSIALKNQTWFFDAWGRDPTVSAACEMLDAMDVHFRPCSGLFEALFYGRCITFHFLELENFGLSDDLYIKMNARGKALTPFENLKAWLVEQVAAEPWCARFDQNLDQSWTDLFWALSHEPAAGGQTFDELFARYFYLNAFLTACEEFRGDYSAANFGDRFWLEKLRQIPAQGSLRELEQRGTFKPVALLKVMQLLEHFSLYRDQRQDEILLRVLKARPEYENLLQFHAFATFQRAHMVGADGGDAVQRHRGRWERVTRNLIRNSRIDELATAILAIRGLTSLAAHAFELYEYLAGPAAAATGFSNEQIEEESRKAKLILNYPEWESLFERAEGHWYLQGRVGFLLDLATESSEIGPDQGRFERYLCAFEACFTRETAASADLRLQRALLSLYDFFPSAGSNRTFCTAAAGSYRERHGNWLAVVQDRRFGKLLDHVVNYGGAALSMLIGQAHLADWRALLISDPTLLQYCGAKVVRWEGDDLLLLTRTRLYGRHAELRSRALYELVRRDIAHGQLSGVAKVEYVESSSSLDWPEMDVDLGAESCRISYRQGAWSSVNAEGLSVDMPSIFLPYLQAPGFQ